MEELITIFNRLKSATIDEQEKQLLKIVDTNKDTLVDLNLSQLMQGENSAGESLGEYKSKEYADFKKTLNPLGVIDLKLEGDFHKGFYADTSKFPILMDSTDSKTNDLGIKYGENIFGVQDKNQEIFNESIIPEVEAYYLRLMEL